MPPLELALPWLFVFAVVYGALEVSGIFKENRRVNALIALVLAFISITSPTVIAFIYAVLPYAAILFVIVFLIGFLLSPLRGPKGERPDYTLAMVMAALIFIFLIERGQKQVTDLLGISAENLLVAAGVIIVALIFFLAYKKGKE